MTLPSLMSLPLALLVHREGWEQLTLAARKPSEKSMISQICCRSGTITTTGLKSAFTDSGSSVRPA